MVFVIHPVFEQGGSFENYSLADIHVHLAHAITHAGLSFIDLRDSYQSYSAQQLALPVPTGVDPWHPNKLGHKIAAQSLLAHIEGMKEFIHWSRP